MFSGSARSGIQLYRTPLMVKNHFPRVVNLTMVPDRQDRISPLGYTVNINAGYTICKKLTNFSIDFESTMETSFLRGHVSST